MSPTCPISSLRIDSNLVRLLSLQIALVTLCLLVSHEPLFAFILLFDFTVRALRMPYLSLFHLNATFFLTKFAVKGRYTDESPKRFALFLGLFVSFLLTVFYFNGLLHTAQFTAMILFICAALETVFDFCIGCRLYYVIQITKEKLRKAKMKIIP